MARPVTKEEQQRLLQDARLKHDTFAQEKARIENLLDFAVEKVKFYRTLLGATESKLCSAEDLIGSIRFRLHKRGVPNPCLVAAAPFPAPDETATSPPGMCCISSCHPLHLRRLSKIHKPDHYHPRHLMSTVVYIT